MDLSIISKSIIRPSAAVIKHLQPFELSIFDQLVPSTYTPLIFFYPTTNVESAQISTQLKTSLTKTLSTTFYPLSGRVKNNSFIGNYEEGALFVETRAKGRLMDFLRDPQVELLNRFLPCRPFSNESDQEAGIPQVNVQANFFDCGGIAIGVSLLHKIIDGSTMSTFLNSWTANARGSCNEDKINPCIFEASLRFPPQKQASVKPYLSMIERNFFNEGKYIARRFVFNAKAVADLREKAIGECLDNPTRTETLTSFIWKSCMEASMLLSASPRPFFSNHVVNLRHRLNPCLSSYSIGNVFTYAAAGYQLPDKKIKFNNLVGLTRRAMREINFDYLSALQGDEMFQFICNSLKLQEEVSPKNHEKMGFSSLLKFDFDNVDFGWGKPIWVSVLGQIGSASSNFILLKEFGWNNTGDIEAWMSLDERIMSIVENDPEFLKFASPNPSII